MNNNVSESEPLALWALQHGRFEWLLLLDILAITIVCTLAIGARYVFTRLAFEGYGQSALVLILMLTPHVFSSIAVIFNNVVITFL